jgi:alkylation response protein AidB-like acyl-CoA dehydrogenase
VTTSAGYRVTGAKDHITNAPVANVALVLGRVPELGRRDITLFLVPTDAPGVRPGKQEQLLGLRTSPTGPLHLDGVELDRDAVLGKPGNGLGLLYDIISFDRLLYGLIAGSFLRPRLDEALDYASRRTAFGVPIADHQYVQGRLTDIRITIETSTAVSWAALDALIDGDRDSSLRCSVAKLVGSEGLAAAAQHLLALHGHLGYERGPVAKVMQDALGTLIAGGTSEMQRKNILNQMRSLAGARP